MPESDARRVGTSKVICFVSTDAVKLLLNRCYSRHSRICHLPAFGEDGKSKTIEVHCVKSELKYFVLLALM